MNIAPNAPPDVDLQFQMEFILDSTASERRGKAHARDYIFAAIFNEGDIDCLQNVSFCFERSNPTFNLPADPIC